MSLLLTETQQKEVVAAIREAEMATSGEVRVHIEHHCPTEDVLDRAKEVFKHLGMHRTELKNGVLFYVAVGDRKFAVIGDRGINERVPHDFWNQVRDLMREQFAHQKYAEGLSEGIKQAGQQLKMFFPRQQDDKNELSDDISFG